MLPSCLRDIDERSSETKGVLGYKKHAYMDGRTVGRISGFPIRDFSLPPISPPLLLLASARWVESRNQPLRSENIHT